MDSTYHKLKLFKRQLESTGFQEEFKDALEKRPDLLCNKTVLNIRAGTGWLSSWCLIFGAAKKVYAVEESETHIIHGCIAENNIKDKVEVLIGNIKDVTVPELVDAIVFDWTSINIINDNILDEIVAARRYLKKDGLIIPEVCELHTGLSKFSSHFGFWNMYGITLKSAEQAYRNSFRNSLLHEPLKEETACSNIYRFAKINFYEASNNELNNAKYDPILTVANSNGIVDGISVWCKFKLFNDNSLSSERSMVNKASMLYEESLEGTRVIFPVPMELEDNEPFCFNLSITKGLNERYCIELEFVEPDEIDHPMGCPCSMTKCRVILACLSNPAFNCDYSSEEENEGI